MGEYTTPPTVRYPMGAGLNQGIPPTELGPGELPMIENFYPFGKKIIRRGGIRRVTSSAFAEALTSFFPYRTRTGDWTLIVSGQSGFGKLSGTGFLTIPAATGVTVVPVNLPFCWFQYNDVAYACRPGGGFLHRITPTVVMKAGIAAPTTAPTIAQGAAGALAAGDYIPVYTYANLNTGAESNPSPLGATLSLASLHQIDWSDLGVSTNPQVNARKLYRTLLNQVNSYYYLATIPNNIDTAYPGDEVLPQDMGDPALFTNYEPPSNLLWATVWNERAFATDGTYLYYSTAYNMEGWSGDAVPVFTDDGHQIRVVYPYGDRLIIGKTNKVHFLIGSDKSTFKLLTLSDKHGCLSGHSMKTAENLLFWFGTGPNFYRSDGNSVVGIADIKIRTILDAIPATAFSTIVAETFAELGWYVATLPGAAGNIVVVYNYRTDAWAVYRHPGDAPSFLAEYFDTNYGRALYGVQGDGHLYHLYDRTKTDDHGTAIAAKLLTRREDGGMYGGKGLRRVHLLCSTAAEEITLKAYRDGRTTPSASRTASLNVGSEQEWKPVNLSTLRDQGSTVQVGLEYSGATAIEVSMIGLDIEAVERYVGQPQ